MMNFAIKSWFFALTAFILAPDFVFAQNQKSVLKAAVIEKITRFVDWPSDSPAPDAAKPFVIGIIGDDPIIPHLKRLAAITKIKGTRAEVRFYSGIHEIDSCQALFIPRSQGRDLSRILAKTANMPILTIGDGRGWIKEGVIVSLFFSGQSLRFEINQRAALKSGLRISSRLLNLAQTVISGNNR
jgi:hypothetical protein